MNKICPICKKEFTTITCQKLCSNECTQKMKINHRERYSKLHRKKINNHMKKYRKTHKDIIKNRAKKYYSTPAGIYISIKAQAKIRNKQFSIIKEDFIDWYNKQIKKCYYCKRTIQETKQDSFNRHRRLTIDRTDNNKGYIVNNIVLACRRCNAIKSNYFTEQEMLKIGKIIQNKEKIEVT